LNSLENLTLKGLLSRIKKLFSRINSFLRIKNSSLIERGNMEEA